MRKIWPLAPLVVVAAAVALLLAMGASESWGTTFKGSCEMSGTLLPTKGYKWLPENNDAEAFGEGACAGTLDGRAYNGPAGVYIDGRMDKPMSCGLLVADRVPGVLTFTGATATRAVRATRPSRTTSKSRASRRQRRPARRQRRAVTVDTPSLDFVVGEAFELLGFMPAHINGAFNGHALAILSLQASAADLAACGTPEGLKRVAFTMQLNTLQALYG